MNCDSGPTTASWTSATTGVVVHLADTTDSATGEGTDDVIGRENAYGSKYDDEITGTAGANTLYGQLGDDTLLGGARDDLYGQDGDDTLRGSDGNDHLYGGNGSDTATYGTAGAAVTVSLASGKASGGDGSDTLELIENLGGSSHGDTLTGNAGANNISGGGNDSITGGGGADTLTGVTGEDTIRGGDGDDVIAGGDDADTLYGDSGNYQITGGPSPTLADKDYLNGGTGTDTCFDNAGVQDTKVACEILTGSATVTVPSSAFAITTGTSRGGGDAAILSFTLVGLPFLRRRPLMPPGRSRGSRWR